MPHPRLIIAGALCALFTTSGWAALGGDAASVLADQTAFAASASSRALTAGAVLHTQTLANGLTIRQYVNSSGQVFAVAWEGPVQPDFVRLLGSRFGIYQEALRQQSRGIQIQTNDLVLESGGMMRAFVGRAYLPGHLPAGLSAESIR